jgi:hypothetical protein
MLYKYRGWVAQPAMVGVVIGQKGGALLLYLPLSLGKSPSKPPLGDKNRFPCDSVIAWLKNTTIALYLPA